MLFLLTEPVRGPALPQYEPTKRVEPATMRSVITSYGYARVPTMFWGHDVARGVRCRRLFALTLRDDWCDSGDAVDTATREHVDAANRRHR